jgi:hypothetical protein
MCEHLIELDRELKSKGIKETFRGQPWSDNTREWVYYDCVLNLSKVRARYDFPDFISAHINDDNRSGTEAGFYCERCKDGVMGLHPSYAQGKTEVT